MARRRVGERREAVDGPGFSRRRLLRGLAVSAALGVGPAAGAPGPAPLRIEDSARPDAASRPFRADAFATVGVFDIDWLTAPRFARLLDNMAASPRGFRGVRVFGALNSGTRENVFPEGGGRVWPDPEARMDFSATLDALTALTSRGLTPFLPLTFFPSAVSPSPVAPPADFAAWQKLVVGFLDRIAERFGAAAIATWWFEVWNEPNMPPFWKGSFDRYLDLYRATSEAVLRSGHDIRLGGPAVAWLPGEGASLIERFLRFLVREPAVKCDFVSFHRKGIWEPEEAEPLIGRSVHAARATAEAMRRLGPERFRGMWIVNDEADMKVGFDAPYRPRMTAQFPAWLSAQMIAHDALEAEYAADGFRFVAASDDANQQLIRAPFDGRRSVMTTASARPDDLVKLPVYGFHELLPLLGDRHGRSAAGEALFPHSDLFHVLTVGDAQIGSLFTRCPGADDGAPARRIGYALGDIPWPVVNVVPFRIDATHGNAFTAAGGALSAAPAGPDAVRRIRLAQELGVGATPRSGLRLPDRRFRTSFALRPFDTLLFWITPFAPDPPAAPEWIEARRDGADAVLRWTPNREAFFYSYEVWRKRPGGTARRISPLPLRAALWIDTAPPSGELAYGVRAVSASGIAIPLVWSGPVRGGAG